MFWRHEIFWHSFSEASPFTPYSLICFTVERCFSFLSFDRGLDVKGKTLRKILVIYLSLFSFFLLFSLKKEVPAY